ncbi:uncharacterized protein KGF55_005725 [Candida pseudojiufengensis]|uniref:uncharacterized protein n=1 Tax=Candida pseudojiufengensis TaxID=497109 RepID=UPI0022244A36|nr:uncharacterized protein KGF55_005725 [Candida pseudojiufengensis]KAI5958727.1 hypothetical protein KGF55_005725 [Candida pseudojiufengensis]
MKISSIIYYLSLSISALAHGDHSQTVLKKKPANLRWQDWHMSEEHNLDEYDGKTFFLLHDLKGLGKWDHDDVLNLYGIKHEQIIGDGSGMGENSITITKETQRMVVDSIFQLFDLNNDGTISLEEWLSFHDAGKELPDFGFGQGHHLDFESEYEEHHWNKYHAQNDPDTKIKHKEDIEHELLHHKHEIEETHDRSSRLKKFANDYLSNIRLDNLTPKYRI